MQHLAVVLLFESVFWNDQRRDQIAQHWLSENPKKAEILSEIFTDCINELLHGSVKFSMNHQMLTFFAGGAYPLMYHTLSKRERSCVFEIFRQREKLFGIHKRLSANMFLLEDSKVDDVLESLLPRRSMVISYISQILTVGGEQLKRPLHLSIRQLQRKWPNDSFLQLLDNFCGNPEGDLFELNHLPADTGEAPSKRARELKIDWGSIVESLQNKKGRSQNRSHGRSILAATEKKKIPRAKRGPIRLNGVSNVWLESQRKRSQRAKYAYAECGAPTLLSAR